MRAKMECTAVVDGTYPETGEKYNETVSLLAVYANIGPNAEWSKATPAGHVSLTIDNPKAWGHFKKGAFYFVDFFETTEDAR